MDQRQIMELLEEAAALGRPEHRRAELQSRQVEILHALGQETVAHKLPRYPYDPNRAEQATGILAVMDTIYVDTLYNRPEVLPGLFPFFAALCGDRRRGRLSAEIDWSVLDR